MIPTRNTHKQMIEHPERWPLGDVLPLVRPSQDGEGDVGTLKMGTFPDGSRCFMIAVNLLITGMSIGPVEVVRYVSSDALLNDGWIVD